MIFREVGKTYKNEDEPIEEEPNKWEFELRIDEYGS